MYDSVDDESDSLLGSGMFSRKPKINPASKKAVMINRIFVILLLAGLVAVSIWFQSFQTAFTLQLSTDEEKIKQLEDTVEAQGKIVARFNESVTNKDVIGQLETMEKRWDQERTELFAQLAQTKKDVEIELSSTMIDLNETVRTAEAEIHEQVMTVKTNFDKYVVQTEHRFSLESDYMKYQVAGTFTVLSCLISMWHMGSHTRKMNQPAIQRKILAILWMCPIYAVSSCLSLVMPSYAGYLGILKDFYESYIIYQFLSFCIAVIGGGDRSKVIDSLAKEVHHLSPPFRVFFCCGKQEFENDRALASAILFQCQGFALQFVGWKPVTAISMVVLRKYDYYGPWAEDAMTWKSIQFWVNIIQNVSIFLCFSGLLKFYHAVEKELQWCRPFAKFLCIKGVVFMTFWQGAALRVLAETTDLGGGDDSADWSEQIQSFLICMEMLLFSIAHFYCFPVDEWQPGYKVNYRKAKFGETLALNDFFSDLKLLLIDGDRKKKKKRQSKKPTESTIPEGDETECESFNGSIRTVDSMDEEDVAKAEFVRALTTGLDSLEDDNSVAEEASATSSVQHQQAQQAEVRLGTMLDEMLAFSQPNSAVNSPMVSPSPQRVLMNLGDRTPPTSGDSNGGRDSQSQGTGVDVESGNMDSSESDNAGETTGLLTRESSSSLNEDLRPSIFTTVSQKQEGQDKDVA